MFRKQVLGALGCALLWTFTSTAAQPKTPEEKALKVGKSGEIILTQPTKVADQVLQPDSYVVQHRDSGSNHYVRFLHRVTVDSESPSLSLEQSLQGNPSYTETDNAGEINCRMEPLSAPAKDTTAYIVTENGVPRITKVAIKGESAVHLFSTT